MKPRCILSLILFSVIVYGDTTLENDVLIYGYNYNGDLQDGKRHGNGKFVMPMVIHMMDNG